MGRAGGEGKAPRSKLITAHGISPELLAGRKQTEAFSYKKIDISAFIFKKFRACGAPVWGIPHSTSCRESHQQYEKGRMVALQTLVVLPIGRVIDST